MGSLVLELPSDAMESSSPATSLIRKALVVARKLGQSDMEAWADAELNGYGAGIEVPEYRNLVGDVRARNPFHGWVPVIIDNAELAETIRSMPCRQAMSELQDILDRGEGKSSPHIPFHPAGQEALRNLTNSTTDFTLFVDLSRIAGVLEGARNVVLSWALQLEEDGILGEDLSFSSKEKEAAAVSHYNVNNFYGDVSQAQVHQSSGDNSEHSSTLQVDADALRELTNSIRASVADLALDAQIEAELKAELATLDAQVDSPKPKPAIVQGTLHSIRSILEGAAGGAGAHLLIALGKLVG